MLNSICRVNFTVICYDVKCSIIPSIFSDCTTVDKIIIEDSRSDSIDRVEFGSY